MNNNSNVESAMESAMETVKKMSPKQRARLLVEFEYNKAVEKHKEFPKSLNGGQAIIIEEYLEMSQAINDYRTNFHREDMSHLVEETCHTIVTLFRFLEQRLDDSNN